MINTLHIKNIGIIDDVTIDLNEGFNVLTGETGAGKTLIIESLQILSGGRFSKEMIRRGEENSFVEASFYLPNLNFEDNMVISREISLKGKNTCKINGRLVTVTELRNFMKNIIDIHGQNENQSILDLNNQINLLDEYSEKELKVFKNKYTSLYEEYIKIKAELDKNYGDDREKQRKLDLLNYQLKEIEDAKLKKGEEKILEEKIKLINSSEKISQNLQESETQINNNIVDSMNYVIRLLEKIEQYSSKYAELVSRLKNSYYEIQEVGVDINLISKDNYFNEEEKFDIEERLDLINSLKRKYGSTIDEILKYKNNIKDEIYEIENLEGYINSLKSKLRNLEEEMMKLAEKMHNIRIKFSQDLSSKINKELKDLEMKNATFSVKIEFNENKKFNKNGLDKIEFLISTNRGEEEKSLIKIASGGEMSRIMLAIKTILASVDKIPIMIFDEIDTGISGIAANVTGEKMKKISKSHQVICVTHLASIAAKGEYNYFISKEILENKTRTTVKLLNEEETLMEIARISSGSITDISLNHAKELRNMNLKETA